MAYEAELNFLTKILAQFHLITHIIRETDTAYLNYDLGLRKFMGLDDAARNFFAHLQERVEPNTIYTISDDFLCNYIFLQLPDKSENQYLLIGPFTNQDISKPDVFKTMERYQISPHLTERLIQYYANITLLSDSAPVFAIINAFAETIYGVDNYVYKQVEDVLSDIPAAALSKDIIDNTTESEDISFKMQLLENRYAAENRFIQNIAQGAYQKAEASFDSSTLFTIENRLLDPIRNFKNYCIIMNTLLRKAAEQGTVHPIHIDKISSEFAQKIEAITSLEQGKKLMREMIRKYGLLVKNYSMQSYSLLVQKVITRIDNDLTADQSLNTHAALLNVRPSYLSTLFHKETGVTLTEYVNRKRVEYGVILLNTTNLQVSAIAQHCGIMDINYFSRIFKKYIGKTPKEYRNSIRGEVFMGK